MREAEKTRRDRATVSIVPWLAAGIAGFCVATAARPAAAGASPPERLVGYGVVNWWQDVNPEELASQLAANGLNLTSIEYVPGRHRDWLATGGKGPDPRQVVDHAKTSAFVRAMRRRGIWTQINMVNWNGASQREMPTSWFRQEFDFIRSEIGADHVILQAVSEWDESDAKAREWASIVAREWSGYKSSNLGTRASSTWSGHMLEYHPCDLGDRRWPHNGDTLVNTDCTPTIEDLNCGSIDGSADPVRTGTYTRDVLATGANFLFYGFQNQSIDGQAIRAIGMAMRGAVPAGGECPPQDGGSESESSGDVASSGGQGGDDSSGDDTERRWAEPSRESDGLYWCCYAGGCGYYRSACDESGSGGSGGNDNWGP